MAETCRHCGYQHHFDFIHLNLQLLACSQRLSCSLSDCFSFRPRLVRAVKSCGVLSYCDGSPTSLISQTTTRQRNPDATVLPSEEPGTLSQLGNFYCVILCGSHRQVMTYNGEKSGLFCLFRFNYDFHVNFQEFHGSCSESTWLILRKRNVPIIWSLSDPFVGIIKVWCLCDQRALVAAWRATEPSCQ